MCFGKYVRLSCGRVLLLVYLLSIGYLFLGLGFYNIWTNNLHLYIGFPIGMLSGPIQLYLIRKSFRELISYNYILHLIGFVIQLFVFICLICDYALKYSYFQGYCLIFYVIQAFLYLFYGFWIGLRYFSLRVTNIKNFILSQTYCILSFVFIILLPLGIVLLNPELNSVIIFLGFNLLFYLYVMASITFVLNKAIRKTSSVVQSFEEEEKGISEELHLLQNERIINQSIIQAYQIAVELFIDSKAYLEIDMNKAKFCQLVQIPQNHVTPYLKYQYGKHFSLFINQLRLAHAAQLLSHDQTQYSMDELSFVCGFNSRASFYRNFISQYGCSPSEFRNQQNISN